MFLFCAQLFCSLPVNLRREKLKAEVEGRLRLVDRATLRRVISRLKALGRHEFIDEKQKFSPSDATFVWAQSLKERREHGPRM